MHRIYILPSRLFWAIAERNLGRARRRYIRACGHVADRNVDSSEDGAGQPEASGDEAIPVEPKYIQFTLPPHFNILLGSQYPHFTVQMIPRPPKRPGGSLDTSSAEERHTSRDPDGTSVGVSPAAFGIPSKAINIFARMRVGAVEFRTPLWG